MSAHLNSVLLKVTEIRRWGLDYAIQEPSTIDGKRMIRWLRTTGELPIQLRRVGWASIGIPKHLQDSLASHHHQVTLQVLLVGSEIKRRGIPFDLERAMSMSGLHDVSEFGGGDYSSSRANAYPQQKADCRIIEARNRVKLCSIIGEDHTVAKEYLKLSMEEMNQTSDEAVVVKICDRLEALLHLRRVRAATFSEDTQAYYENNIRPLTQNIGNTELKSFMDHYIESFISLDEKGQLGGKTSERSESRLKEYERLVITSDRLQMMKHVDRTAWAVGGLNNSDFDTLAEHGHATSIATWSMATALAESGIKINMRNALVLALLQEVGKINGGDVAIASNNPSIEERAAAHRLRKGSFAGCTHLLNPDLAKQLQTDHEDALSRESDEAKLMMTMSRVMDYLHYDLVQKPNYTNRYRQFTGEKILSLAEAISNPLMRFAVVRTVKEMILEIESGKLRRTIHALMGVHGSYVIK